MRAGCQAESLLQEAAILRFPAQRRKGTRIGTERRGGMRKHRKDARSSTDVRASDKNV